MSVFSNSRIKHNWFVRKIAPNPLFLALVILPIPIFGLLLEWYCFKNAFGRSGAIMVCVAIFCVYVNHFVDVESDNVKSAIQSVLKLGSTQQTILNNINPTIQGQMRANTAATMYQLLQNAQAELPKLNDARQNIVRVEFIAGIFGTLIWGFGDLINLMS